MKARSIVFLSACIALLGLVPSYNFVYAQNAKPLKIGAIFSTTGRAAALGIPENQTVQMLMKQVNDAGGVNGFPLEVIIENDQTLASGAKGAAEKLIHKDNVLAILGPSISGNSLEVKSICESNKVPLVSCAAAEAIVTPAADSRFIFKTAQLDSHAVTRILEEIQKRGISKIAVLVEKSPFGTEGAKHFTDLAPTFGVEIVAEETFNVNDTDMADQVKSAKKAGAGAMVTWGLVPTQSIVAKNMKNTRWKVPLFFSHSFGNPKNIKTAGAAVEGIVFPTGRLLVVDHLPMTHFHRQVLVTYKTAFEKQYGPASAFGGYAHDAFWLVVNAIKAKNITPSTKVDEARRLIRDGLEQTQGWTGVTGTFTMSPDDHMGLDKDKSLEMCTVKNGKIVPLTPSK